MRDQMEKKCRPSEKGGKPLMLSHMRTYLAILCVLALIQMEGCYTIHENMFFEPVKLVKLSGDIKFNEVYFTVDDSISINAWYFTKENADAVILLLHGNTRNLYSHPWADIINSLSKLNVNIFAIDYRGYGRSSGTPSFRGIHQDAEGALDYLRQHNPGNKPIIVYGLSMGTIPAVTVAAKPGVAGLILEGAISSTKDALDATRSHFWILNLVQIEYDKALEFDLTKEIQHVKSPLLIIHGKNDDLPESMSLKLYDAVANSKRYYWSVDNGTHCDTYKVEPEEYLKRLSDFVDESRSLK